MGSEIKYRTKSGYVVLIRKVSPLVFLELQDKYDIFRRFTYTEHIEETGATLEFDYEFPETPPSRAEDPVAYTRYHQYLAWEKKRNIDMAQYRRMRNSFLLSMAVKILSGPQGTDWKRDFAKGAWIDRLKDAGIDVNKSNAFVMYLKAKVLADEQDYLTVIEYATVGEVTLADVKSAFDRFQNLFQRISSGESARILTPRECAKLDDVIRGADSVRDGDKPRGVVRPAGADKSLPVGGEAGTDVSGES